jgi:YHS domain-containing protein
MKAGVEDHAAFQTSLETILGWDFDCVIVGHGDVMEFNGKAKLHTALVAAGFPLAPIEFQPDQTQSMTTDPMCGLAVDTSTALHAEREGETFYFCSETCRQKFLVTPGESNPFGKSGGSGG